MKYFNVFLGFVLSLALLVTSSFADIIQCPTGSETDNWTYNLTDDSGKPTGEFAASTNVLIINNKKHIVKDKILYLTPANISPDPKGTLLTCKGDSSFTTLKPGETNEDNEEARFTGNVTAKRIISSDEYNLCTVLNETSFDCSKK